MGRWIKIHSSVLDWEWFDDANMVKAWIYLLAKAEWQDRKWRGEVIKRGSLMTSRSQLAEELGMTERQVRTILTRLKTTGNVTCKKTNKYSIVTICNYDTYQITNDESDQQSDQQSDQRATSRAKEQEERTKEEIRKETQTLKNASLSSEAQEILKPADFVAIWNSGCPSKIASPRLTDHRRRQLKARIEEITAMGLEPKEVFRICAEKVEASEFASGRDGRWKTCGFIWILDHPEHWLKVYQGNYDNVKERQSRCPSTTSVAEQLYQAKEEAKRILGNYNNK